MTSHFYSCYFFFLLIFSLSCFAGFFFFKYLLSTWTLQRKFIKHLQSAYILSWHVKTMPACITEVDKALENLPRGIILSKQELHKGTCSYAISITLFYLKLLLIQCTSSFHCAYFRTTLYVMVWLSCVFITALFSSHKAKTWLLLLNSLMNLYNINT